MSIQRWDPWRDILSLRDAMNGLLEESFVRPRAELMAMTTGMPLDLRETDDAFIVETVLPGVSQDQVNISVLGDTLRISAEVRESEQHQQARWLIRERRFGSFERSLTLPAPVRPDDAEADFKDGILTIRLPKSEPAAAREIQVRSTMSATETEGENESGEQQR